MPNAPHAPSSLCDRASVLVSANVQRCFVRPQGVRNPSRGRVSVGRGSPTPPQQRPQVSVRRGSPTPPQQRPQDSVRRGSPTPPQQRPQDSETRHADGTGRPSVSPGAGSETRAQQSPGAGSETRAQQSPGAGSETRAQQRPGAGSDTRAQQNPLVGVRIPPGLLSHQLASSGSTSPKLASRKGLGEFFCAPKLSSVSHPVAPLDRFRAPAWPMVDRPTSAAAGPPHRLPPPEIGSGVDFTRNTKVCVFLRSRLLLNLREQTMTWVLGGHRRQIECSALWSFCLH
jgi:hypothetical protein